MTITISSNPLTSPVTTLSSFPPFSSKPTTSITPSLTLASHYSHPPISLTPTSLNPLKASTHPKYTYPDPIPEFAESETQRFKSELLRKLSSNKEIGRDLNEVVTVCAEIFRDFLDKEYGGPGTLLVEPFTDMLVALKVKKLPGAPAAARAALLWSQNYLDRDWQEWISRSK